MQCSNELTARRAAIDVDERRYKTRQRCYISASERRVSGGGSATRMARYSDRFASNSRARGRRDGSCMRGVGNMRDRDARIVARGTRRNGAMATPTCERCYGGGSTWNVAIRELVNASPPAQREAREQFACRASNAVIRTTNAMYGRASK